MNVTANLTIELEPSPAPDAAAPCGATFSPFGCVQWDAEQRVLAVVILALACAVLSLCVLACVLTLLVHKISATLMRAALGNNAAQEGDPNDARKELLGTRLRSSFSSKGKGDGKKKKASFVEDTSCAAPRDVDEEDL